MTTQARTKRYDESYESGEIRVEVDWDGEVAEYRVWHRGDPDAAYVGPSVLQAEQSSGLSADEWDELLASDNLAEYE